VAASAQTLPARPSDSDLSSGTHAEVPQAHKTERQDQANAGNAAADTAASRTGTVGEQTAEFADGNSVVSSFGNYVGRRKWAIVSVVERWLV